ncbi:MAG TPA: hypothetical protein VMT27_00080, partial [Actinomycetes bacterium]|nr:hypothetical protein [Actinomycetes bacterium]
VYFLTGLKKVIHSGLGWVTSDNLSWVLYAGAQSDRSLAPDLARSIAGAGPLPHLIAAVAITLELSAPLLLAGRWSRLVFAAAVAGMHAGIGLLLGLDYSAWVLTVLAVVMPWDQLWRVARRRAWTMPRLRTSWESR